ncbi:MAG: lysylphosphatidylglycerol synthase transmembrane domain-containing protein, partial [Halobacteriota archaeon]
LKLLAAFAVAMSVVYLLGAYLGWEETLDTLGRAHPGLVGLACLSTLGCLAVWAATWGYALDAVDVEVGYSKLLVTFYAASFVNYVTPMGQAGGEPFVAYVLSRDTEASYEESLASVLTADVLRLLPFFTAAAIGLAYLVVRVGLPEEIQNAAVVLVALAVAMPVALVVAWRRRRSIELRLVRLARKAESALGVVDSDDVARRLEELNESFERIASSPVVLAVALALGYLGWILFALPLYFSAEALGLHVPLLVVAFAVPLTVVTSFTPLPGGLGAIEGTLVVVLPLTTALSAQEAFAVTALYRLTSYWIVVVVGGVAAAYVVYRA